MTSLDQFSRRIRLRAEDLARNVDQGVKQAALAVDQAVVLGTPVDTGLARSNWLVTRVAPRQGTINAYSPGERLGIGEQQNAAGALAQGQAAVRSRRPGEDIIIQNNVEYIGLLNDGSSQQAPANFVATAVMAGISAVRRRRYLDAN